MERALRLVRDGERRAGIVYEQPTFVEITSAAFDPDRAGVGSSGFEGDAANTFVPVPPDPSPPDVRYLFSLCSVWVPAGHTCRIIGLRQAVILRADQTTEQEDPPLFNTSTATCQVVTPNWVFPDGNVAFHLRWYAGSKQPYGPTDPNQPVGQSPKSFERESALLYNVADLPTYGPPSKGAPPGDAIGSLGTIRDNNRFPWVGEPISMDYSVEGPGDVLWMCSVKQTDPESRAPPVTVATPLLLPNPEDRFLQLFPTLAIYGWVAGSLLCEIGPVPGRTLPRMGEPCP